MSMWVLLLWGSSVISALELTAIVLFSNRNNGEPNVEFDSFLSTGSFEFKSSCGSSPIGMSSADEWFLNGQIRPMSPLRTTQFQWQEHEDNEASHHHHHHHHHILELDDSENKEAETPSIKTTPSGSASSSRSSSSGRNSKKWIFFKDLLYGSKSEGRDNKKKFWSSITFTCSSSSRDEKEKNCKEMETQKQKRSKQVLLKKPIASTLGIEHRGRR
ncbi:uncharacterized protein LOC114268118 [Camellia sinensis]|uniref:uncharacterized protein LOC114268118 n=1 Tax=Camellia sinensis TaxID=4442 RepID=UPI001035EC5B|nr:uncharacterized protein LOC114268118 [Camellia sinensis]